MVLLKIDLKIRAHPNIRTQEEEFEGPSNEIFHAPLESFTGQMTPDVILVHRWCHQHPNSADGKLWKIFHTLPLARNRQLTSMHTGELLKSCLSRSTSAKFYLTTTSNILCKKQADLRTYKDYLKITCMFHS